MDSVTLRFYAELNDYLLEGADRVVECAVGDGEEVGRLIQACGVPLDVVEMILVDGVSVSPTYRAGPGDRVAVYPVFEAFDVSSELRIRTLPLRRTRFTVTPELPALAGLLRDRGFDVQVDSTAAAGRILLTTDAVQLEGTTHGLLVEGDEPAAQLRRLVERLHLDVDA